MGKWGPLRWATPGELRRAGVLGINRRNGDYILPHNPREHYPRVNDKYLTKQLCHERGSPSRRPTPWWNGTATYPSFST